MDAIEEVNIDEIMKDLNDRLFRHKNDDVTNSYTAKFNKYEFAILVDKIQQKFDVEFGKSYLSALINILEAKRLLEGAIVIEGVNKYVIMRDIFTRIIECTNIENIFIGMEEKGIEDESTESH